MAFAPVGVSRFRHLMLKACTFDINGSNRVSSCCSLNSPCLEASRLAIAKSAVSRKHIVCSAVQESSSSTVSPETREAKSEAEPEAKSEAKAPPAKPKPAAKVPVKALPEMMEEDVIPSLRSILESQQDITELELVFQDNRLEGSFRQDGKPYAFWAFFPDGNLTGPNGFSLLSYGFEVSTVEPFLVDEKKPTAKQSVDSCDNNDMNFNDTVTFDTADMSCQIIWPKRGFILRYAQTKGLWSFILSATDPNGWVGFGFSTNGHMKGSSAMVGWVNLNGVAKIQQYYLKDYYANTVIPGQGELIVVNNSETVFHRSNRIYLAFQLSTTQPRTFLLYTVGPKSRLPSASNQFRLAAHIDQLNTKIDYQTGQSKAEKNRPHTNLRRTHGALNMIGWGILMPVGAIVARYFRQWDPIWFYSHTVIQISSFLLGLVGFILGFIHNRLNMTPVMNHRSIGITIFILGCLQVTALIFRPEKGSKLRNYWNLYHHNGGRVLIALALSNIFYGLHLGGEGVSWNATYAVIVALMFVSAIVLEVRLRKR